VNTHHRINYIELPASDLPAVKAFYETAFGWTFTDYGPDYTAFNDGSLDGGFTAGEVVGTAGPLVILYSDDVEGSLEAVTAAGGQIVRPIYTFPGGRRFHFLDPAGNQLAVWSE
jgi:predicted enzyme related to lactoylglutathione lyase